MSKSTWQFLLVGIILTCTLCTAEDWRPVSKAELEMKEYPGHPGVSAVILYRKHWFDDSRSTLTNYYRLKILTEAGRSQANIETVPIRANEHISDFRARVIHPDGTVIPATSEIFEKVVAKYKSVRSTVKTMALPEVTVGSVIEYQYRVEWPETSYRMAAWDLEDKLFTREAHFYFKPYPVGYYTWHLTASGKLKDVAPNEQKDKSYTLDLQDVDAYEEESYMPPEANAKSWIIFYYVKAAITADKFWDEASSNWNKSAEDYLNKSSKTAAAVPTIISGATNPEAKLRAIYGNVQKIRNLSFEKGKSQQEIDRQKLDEAKNPDETLVRAYGYKIELTRLFVAMARAAGLDARAVRVPDREELFFIQDFRSFGQFDTEIAYVRTDQKEYWLDPSTPFCPFGMLPWYYTDVIAIRSGKSGGEWTHTPKPQPDDAKIVREGDLTLSSDGLVSGELKVTYAGQEALSRRIRAAALDDAEREKEAEDGVKSLLPQDSQVELTDTKALQDGNEPLTYSFKIKVPSLTTSTKSRLLVPIRLFSAARNPFRPSNATTTSTSNIPIAFAK